MKRGIKRGKGAILFWASLLLFFSIASATEPMVMRNIAPSLRIDVNKELANVSELLKTIHSTGDTMLTDDEEYPELPISNMFWDNTTINPYRNAVSPEGMRIDCRGGVLPTMGHICSNYGFRRQRMHSGTDLKLQLGDPVVAAFDGKVRFARSYMAYGNVVVIRHPNGLETVYAHLSKIQVTVDQTVKAGDVIGLGGRTGRATATHLHFEVRLMGRTINPSELFDFTNKTVRTPLYVYTSGRKKRTDATPVLVNAEVHVLRKGESLSIVSRKYRVSVKELCRLNNLSESTILHPGQQIRLKESPDFSDTVAK